MLYLTNPHLAQLLNGLARKENEEPKWRLQRLAGVTLLKGKILEGKL